MATRQVAGVVILLGRSQTVEIHQKDGAIEHLRCGKYGSEMWQNIWDLFCRSREGETFVTVEYNTLDRCIERIVDTGRTPIDFPISWYVKPGSPDYWPVKP